MKPLVTVQDALLIALVFSRLIALFMSFPFMSSAMMPRNIKILLVVALSFFFVKSLDISFSLERLHLFKLFLMIAKELLVGFALGLLINFYIAAFSYAAEVISYFMGLTIANIFDPSYGQVSILSKFFLMLFYLLFFISGAYEYFLSAIALSFQAIPLGLEGVDQGIWRYIIELSGVIFLLGFKLAFPFALILYLINLSLALVNRLIPQINVFIVGLPLQIFIGLAALAFGASVIVYLGASFLQRAGEEYIYLINHLG